MKIGERILVETWSDDVWGSIVSYAPGGFMFLGDGWSIPLFFTYRAIIRVQA